MNVLDLFSGIGGFSLGLERAGMRTVAFCEIDSYCRAVLAKHWPNVPVFGDVRELTAQVLANAMRDRSERTDRTVERSAGTNTGDATQDGSSCGENSRPRSALETGNCRPIDLICGGFPCQDISVAGKGAGIGGERSGLWSEYARIIGEVRPRYVIVENVAALLGRGLERVLGDLAALGFDAEWHCIPASAVGAPHRRDRVWIIAHANSRGQSQFTQCDGQSLAEFNGAFRHDIERCGDDVADATSARQSQPQWTGASLRNGKTLELAGLLSEPSRTWLTEPDVGRVAHGVSFELDLVREIEDGNCNCQETEPEAQVVIWRLLRAMWEHRAAATTSCDLYRRRLYGSVPELPRGDPHSFWHLGPWIEEDKELCGLWADFYAQPFEKAQDLQRHLLERIGTKKRPQALGSRVDRLTALGNAIIPQIAEIIGRAIMTAEREQYDADDDITKSFEEAYRAIRERMANGGPGWTPKP